MPYVKEYKKNHCNHDAPDPIETQKTHRVGTEWKCRLCGKTLYLRTDRDNIWEHFFRSLTFTLTPYWSLEEPYHFDGIS